MIRPWLISALLVLILPGCGGNGSASADVTRLELWTHSGKESERRTIAEQVERFNSQQNSLRVEITYIPERSYNAQVQAAAVAGDLPDILELDGPYVSNYAWQGHLRSLEGLLPKALREDLLTSILKQGTYHGELYAVGSFDSGLGLYARRKELKAAGVRIPNGPQDAWSAKEFRAALKALARRDGDGKVLDLKLNYPGEWLTYAFSPIIQSAGGDLIDRSDYQSSQGILNGPAAVRAMEELQSWVRAGYIDPNIDDAAFVNGRVALSWSGHWDYRRYAEAFKEDLVLLPLPNFGQGARTGQGSWTWSITQRCEHPEAAARFLEFLLQPKEILAMVKVNGAVPGTHTAIARSELYRAKGPLHLFVEQLRNGYAVPRPRTPAYPVITAAFQQAFLDIRNGADVQKALGQAVAEIDQDIRANKGYPLHFRSKP